MSNELIDDEAFIQFFQQQPTITVCEDGGFVWTECVDCGVDVGVDEDGCCSCGRDALRYGKNKS